MILLNFLILLSLAVSAKSGVKQSAVESTKLNVKENTPAVPSWTSEVRLEGTVYTITKPIRYTSAEQLKTQDFKKEFFYLDFTEKALSDPIISQSKSDNPPLSIDNCIGTYLSDGVRKHKQNMKYIPPSLQMAAITCFAKETLDKSGYILEHGADLAAKEKLILNKDLGQFFVPYMTGVNLTQEEKESPNPPDCLNDPNHPNLTNCFTYKCDLNQLVNSAGASRDDVCGKFCTAGQAFLYGDLATLNYMNFPKDKSPSHRPQGAFGKTAFEIKLMIENKNSSFKNYCFKCPIGSRPNEYGNTCLDENGCKILTERFFPAKKICVSKFAKDPENSCVVNCNYKIEIINSELEALGSEKDFIGSGILRIYKITVPPEKWSSLITEYQVRASQLLEKFRITSANCKEASSNCNEYEDLLMQLALKYNSMICPSGQARLNSYDGCTPMDCIFCKQEEQVVNDRYLRREFEGLSEIRASCGQWISDMVLDEIVTTYKQRLDAGYLKCKSGEKYNCNLPEITANEIQNYAIRAGFDCAKKNQKTTTR